MRMPSRNDEPERKATVRAWARASAAGERAERRGPGNAKSLRLVEDHPLRQGIAGAKLAHQSMCQGHDDRRLHGEMARPQLARQLAGLPQQGRRGVEAAVEHLPQGGGRRRLGQSRDRDPGGGHPVLGQIDAIESAIVVAAVLQVVDHLERAAEGVACRIAGRILAMQIEQIAPDGIGRERAIAEKVVPVVVAQLDRVLLESRHEIDAVLRRHAGLPQAGAQAVGGRERRIVCLLAGDGLLEAVEAADFVFGLQIWVVRGA
jgi:hypothetical protein